MKKKLGFISLGCSKNLVDTEKMVGLMEEGGYEMTEQLEEADVIIVNTCTFIEPAKDESVETLLEAASYKKSGHCEKLVAAGCLTQEFQAELAKEIPEIDILLGTNSWHRILEAVTESYREDKAVQCFDTAPCEHEELIPRRVTTPAYSAYVKIAEGCSNGCTFCYIPYVRGRMRSRPIDSVMTEVKELAARGVTEINVIAQDVSCYGRDLRDGTTLSALLREMVKIDGIKWIRLFYLYPTNFTDELLALIETEPKICKYVDIPLQHISDSVLARMHRRDTAADIRRLLQKIRTQEIPIAVRTTLMVGFPGETEEDFQELVDFVKETKFDAMGAFMFSPQDGTPAAKMENQIPENVKEARYDLLMATQAAVSEENDQTLIGREMDVLVEELTETEDGSRQAIGRTELQAPEVDGVTYVENPGDAKIGDYIRVRITDGYAYDLIAERIGMG